MERNSSLLIRGMITAQMSRRRTVVAFLVAPLIVPFVFYLPFPGESVGAGKPSTLSLLFGPLIYSLYALPIVYAAELLLGIPGWMVFRRLRRSFATSLRGSRCSDRVVGQPGNTSSDGKSGDETFNGSLQPLREPLYFHLCCGSLKLGRSVSDYRVFRRPSQRKSKVAQNPLRTFGRSHNLAAAPSFPLLSRCVTPFFFLASLSLTTHCRAADSLPAARGPVWYSFCAGSRWFVSKFILFNAQPG
jgi:hypothetical protein